MQTVQRRRGGPSLARGTSVARGAPFRVLPKSGTAEEVSGIINRERVAHSRSLGLSGPSPFFQQERGGPPSPLGSRDGSRKTPGHVRALELVNATRGQDTHGRVREVAEGHLRDGDQSVLRLGARRDVAAGQRDQAGGG
jgi:hypothetical protein